MEDDCTELAARLAFYFFCQCFRGLFVVSLLGYVPIETRLAEAVAQLEAYLPQ